MAVEKRNIFLSNTIEPLPYKSKRSQGAQKRIPNRDIEIHANNLRLKLDEAYKQAQSEKSVAAIRYKEGTYLEFSGLDKHDLAVKSLENLKAGIRLLNVKVDKETDIVRATVFVPSGKETFFIDKVDKYLGSYKQLKSSMLYPKDTNRT